MGDKLESVSRIRRLLADSLRREAVKKRSRFDDTRKDIAKSQFDSVLDRIRIKVQKEGDDMCKNITKELIDEVLSTTEEAEDKEHIVNHIIYTENAERGITSFLIAYGKELSSWVPPGYGIEFDDLGEDPWVYYTPGGREIKSKDPHATVWSGRKKENPFKVETLFVPLMCSFAGRRNGVRLLQKAEDLALARGYSSITLRAASKSLESYYQKMGYKEQLGCPEPSPESMSLLQEQNLGEHGERRTYGKMMSKCIPTRTQMSFHPSQTEGPASHAPL